MSHNHGVVGQYLQCFSVIVQLISCFVQVSYVLLCSYMAIALHTIFFLHTVSDLPSSFLKCFILQLIRTNNFEASCKFNFCLYYLMSLLGFSLPIFQCV